MAELTRTRSMQDVVTKKKIAKADGGVEARAELLKYVRSHGGQRVIHSILIANNGMAATKSIISMREWAFETFGNERALSFVTQAGTRGAQHAGSSFSTSGGSLEVSFAAFLAFSSRPTRSHSLQ